MEYIGQDHTKEMIKRVRLMSYKVWERWEKRTKKKLEIIKEIQMKREKSDNWRKREGKNRLILEEEWES